MAPKLQTASNYIIPILSLPTDKTYIVEILSSFSEQPNHLTQFGFNSIPRDK
jgi:hypothetical protein